MPGWCWRYHNGCSWKSSPREFIPFLQLLRDNNDVCEESEDEERRKSLSIAQDIVSLSSGGSKQTPTQPGIGLTIHQTTQSKDLVQLLHAAEHSVCYDSVNYDTIRRVDTTLANACVREILTAQQYHYTIKLH